MKKRSILDRAANWLGYIKQGLPVSTVSSLNAFSNPPSKTEEYLKEYKGWIFGCVKARSNDVANIKLKLMRVVDRKTGEAEEVKDHEVLTLLRSVNSWQTFRDLIKATQVYIDLAGESFWFLVKNAAGSKILEIWILRPDWMKIKTDEKDFITGYEYTVPGSNSKFTFKPDEIIHYKEFNPLDMHRGMSIVRAAALTVDTDNFAQRYNRNFFENSAIPEIVLSTEQKLDDALIKRMKAAWQKEYGGTKKAHRIAILEGGLDIKPFSISQKEMEFLAGQNYNANKILALFQTPKSVLGMTENVNLNNAEATDVIFSKRVIKPAMESIRDTLNEFLLPQFGDDLFFEIEDPVPQNVEVNLKRYDTLFKVGAITPNEIRQFEGLDEVEGLDNFYLPLNLTPITGEDESSGEEEPVKRIKSRYIKTDLPARSMKEMIADKITNKIASKLKVTLSKYYKSAQKDSDLGKTSWSVDKQEAFWKLFIKQSDSFEARYKKTIRDIFKRQEKETLERLETATKALTPKDINKILFSLDTENKVSIKLLLPIMRQFMEEQGNNTLDELGMTEIAFDSATITARQFLTDSALRGIKAINKVTKSKLRKVLSFGIGEGESIAEIKRKIKNVFTEATSVRAERIARTEIIKAGNRGTLEAYNQSGVVAGKEWFTALDERVCQWCQPMHGKTKAIDGNFFNQGETFTGKDGGQLPIRLDDIPAPPLHPNCRCVLVPITSDGRMAKPSKKDNNVDLGNDELMSHVKEIVNEETEKVKKQILEDVDSKVKNIAKDL